MIRLAIVVEGETEEEFVKRVLTPHLQTREVEATPHSIGGNVTVERLAHEMANYFWSYDRVTLRWSRKIGQDDKVYSRP